MQRELARSPGPGIVMLSPWEAPAGESRALPSFPFLQPEDLGPYLVSLA